MSVTLNSSPMVLATLQNLSNLRSGRSLSLGLGHLRTSTSNVRAFGGIGMGLQRSGGDATAKVRYGAIAVRPRAQGSAFSKSPGVHPVVDRGYDNPGVRFGDHVRGRGRPISAAGETSCHFSQTSVSKTSPIREMITAARGGRRRTGSKAAAHVEYIERDGAPEKIDKYELLYGARFTAEMERRAADRSASAQQAYIERAGAAEGIERVPRRPITDDDLDALNEASFGTIGQTIEERRRFWVAVEAAEASPKGDRLQINPSENPAWWQKATSRIGTAPATARQALKDARLRDDGKPFEIKLPTDKAFALHQWAVAIDHEAPVEVSPGRGGRTQTRIIAELPYELDGRERLQVVRDFTDKLAEKGFPFWAVVHAPDEKNDARNYHAHIAYYDRPCAKIKKLDGSEVWDFDILEEITWKNRTKHLVRTRQQNRDRSTHDRKWITELRNHWETATNRVLQDAGQTKRYNLGTYESMGISLKPQKHINPRTFNKERKGELTDEGPILARRQWDAEQDNVLRDHQNLALRRLQRINSLANQACAGMKRHPRGELAGAVVERLRESALEASTIKAKADLLRDLGRVVMDRVMSRPKLILIEAMKQDERSKKKFASTNDAESGDRLIATGRIFGTETRNQLAELVVSLSDQAVRMDTEHNRRVQIANARLREIVQELTAWAQKPLQPLTASHVVRLQTARAPDLSTVELQRRARIVAFQAGFMQELKKTLPKFLEIVSQRAGTGIDANRSQAEKSDSVQEARHETEERQTDSFQGTTKGETILPPTSALRAAVASAPPVSLQPSSACKSTASPSARLVSPEPKKPLSASLSTATPLGGQRSDGRPNPSLKNADTQPKFVFTQNRAGTGAPRQRDEPPRSIEGPHDEDPASPVDSQSAVDPKRQVNEPSPVHGVLASTKVYDPIVGIKPHEIARISYGNEKVQDAGTTPVRGKLVHAPQPVSTPQLTPAGPMAVTSTSEGTSQGICPASVPTAPTQPSRGPAHELSIAVRLPSHGKQGADLKPSELPTSRMIPPEKAPGAVALKAPNIKPRYRMPEQQSVAEFEADIMPVRNEMVKNLQPDEAIGQKTDDDEFRPDKIEIVRATRPPKKQLPRQRQRSRDNDHER